jgi:hypothetical protein
MYVINVGCLRVERCTFSSQERVRLKTELEDLRRRLHEAERELVESKEEAIQHHSTIQTLEREVILDSFIVEFLV